MASIDDIAGQEVTLAGVTDLSAAQVRHAGIVLASRALEAAEGDWDAAGAMLRGPLEAIGAIGYEPGIKPGPYGHPRQAKEAGR